MNDDITCHKCSKCGKEVEEGAALCADCLVEMEIEQLMNQIEM